LRGGLRDLLNREQLPELLVALQFGKVGLIRDLARLLMREDRGKKSSSPSPTGAARGLSTSTALSAAGATRLRALRPLEARTASIVRSATRSNSATLISLAPREPSRVVMSPFSSSLVTRRESGPFVMPRSRARSEIESQSPSPMSLPFTIASVATVATVAAKKLKAPLAFFRTAAAAWPAPL
jgi:hypothetical protein